MENLSNWILIVLVSPILGRVIFDWLKERRNGKNSTKILCPLEQKDVIGYLSVISQTLETKDKDGIPLRFHLSRWNERFENMEGSLKKICQHFTAEQDDQ